MKLHEKLQHRTAKRQMTKKLYSKLKIKKNIIILETNKNDEIDTFD